MRRCCQSLVRSLVCSKTTSPDHVVTTSPTAPRVPRPRRCGRTRDNADAKLCRPRHKFSVKPRVILRIRPTATAAKQWAKTAPGTMPRRLRSVNATGWLTVESLKIMTSLPLHRDIPDDYIKNGGGMWPKCGTKGCTYGGAACREPRLSHMRRPVEAAGLALSTPGNFKPLKRLTVWRAEDYIGPLGRAAAWRDCASAKPLTV
jgi:hypothetical protein